MDYTYLDAGLIVKVRFPGLLTPRTGDWEKSQIVSSHSVVPDDADHTVSLRRCFHHKTLHVLEIGRSLGL